MMACVRAVSIIEYVSVKLMLFASAVGFASVISVPGRSIGAAFDPVCCTSPSRDEDLLRPKTGDVVIEEKTSQRDTAGFLVSYSSAIK
jgi:hypothetical protein